MFTGALGVRGLQNNSRVVFLFFSNLFAELSLWPSY